MFFFVEQQNFGKQPAGVVAPVLPGTPDNINQARLVIILSGQGSVNQDPHNMGRAQGQVITVVHEPAGR